MSVCFEVEHDGICKRSIPVSLTYRNKALFLSFRMWCKTDPLPAAGRGAQMEKNFNA